MHRVKPDELLLAVHPRRKRALGLAVTVLVAGASCAEAPEPGQPVAPDVQQAALAASTLTVTLKTWSGHYLVADKGGGADLMAYSTQAQDWETFTLTDVNGGSLVSGDVVTLQSISGQWGSAINGGGGAIKFTAPAPQAWEQFSVVKLAGSGDIINGDKIALKTTVTGQFVSAANAGGSTVTAAGATAREWETLTLGVLAGGGGGGTGPDFGPNVFIFDPSMPTSTIQSRLNSIFAQQEKNHFGNERYAYFFKPGQYNLDVQIGFYMNVFGLGQSPDDVTITGAVRTKADWFQGNATQNFWRGTENLSVVPTLDSNKMVWAVSQATTMRRVHVKGSINLWDSAWSNAWSSGGFIADSKIDNVINSGTQQQFLTRNTSLNNWQGQNWNMVFVGDEQAPSGTWPNQVYTVVDTTPVIREKPYLFIDSAGNYAVKVPSLRTNSKGRTWANGITPGAVLSIDQFHIARSDRDTASTLNAALSAGKHLILTPGIYHLSGPLQVSNPGTIVLGLGLATLIPDQGTSAMNVADVDGVTIAGILFDAGINNSPVLITLGNAANAVSHAANPTALFDVSCRVGGAAVGNATSCLTVNSNDVLLDNIWLWRADHGSGVGWDVNKGINGITVNGNNVSAYGLFVEHFEGYQTLWNGNGGRVYFYQSEIPYDVPNQSRWTHDGVRGYASYKVANSVTSHDARGLGIYSVFWNPVILENAIETPSNSGVKFQHMITVFLGSTAGAAINHIINGTGNAVTNQNMVAKSSY
ncbi:hypothetical protein POL68_09495 [Stigmatella sp. ncwal1]|uniref:Coagulation factor 5/8 type domain-containing protein n=1 Tax=Stigmatella ashevillensis TaxID=2995309 RepID=A0ABT5D4W4_9BACT|nr:hypothetical protein [Stigmatella ashevillena]MDC0708701.1 hypothetical protein [Stigmatella ashevillena]